MHSVFTKVSVLMLIVSATACSRKPANEKPADAPDYSGTVISDEKKDSLITTDNKQKTNKSNLTDDESDFLKKTIDARMMGILEGKAALKKGSTQAIKNYGALMVKDQSLMLKELKDLMQDLSVTIPDTISEPKQDGLEDLMEKESKKFDKKFIKMMRIDHRRDVRLFSQAKEFENKKVRSFAVHYLPMIESHLEKIKELKKTEKEDRKAKGKVSPTANKS